MNRLPGHRLVADPAYARLKESLIAWSGLAYFADKDRELAERIAARLAHLGLSDCTAYAAFLDSGTAGQHEREELVADLTIGETFFFRHRELFDAVQTIVLPDLIARNQRSRTLRIWSAGCATGAEPYSLAMVLKNDFAQQLAGWNVSIIGTDINQRFLASAREGVFDEWALRSQNEQRKSSCFSRVGKHYRINPEFQEGVSFQYHNLVSHPFPSLLNNLVAFDLILCRNVTIYFGPDVIRTLIGQFHESLVDGGWFLVGHAEPNISLFQSFRAVNAPGAVLYQKAPKHQDDSIRDFSAQPPSYWSPALPELGPPIIEAIEPDGPASASASTEPEALAGRLGSPPVEPSSAANLETIRALADRGAWIEATTDCEKLLETDKLNPRVHFYHGLVLEQLGRHEPAEKALRRAIYLDRGFVLGHYYLGLLLQKNARLAQSAQAFQNALRLLTRIDPEQPFDDGDGICAGELRKLTEMHLKVLEDQ